MIIDTHTQHALSIQHNDPELLNLDLSDWSIVYGRSGDWVHKNGARFGLTGPAGRWVAYIRGKRRYYKKPSTVIKLLTS